jgi:hypothetical protein
LGDRMVVTTSISRKSKRWFEKHPLYTVGRALDDWVKQKAGLEADEQAKKLQIAIEALVMGACACGRIVFNFHGKDKCAGCEPLTPVNLCKCEPTIDLRRRRLIEWQLARSEVGVATTAEDIQAKRDDLGIGWDHWQRPVEKAIDEG